MIPFCPPTVRRRNTLARKCGSRGSELMLGILSTFAVACGSALPPELPTTVASGGLGGGGMGGAAGSAGGAESIPIIDNELIAEQRRIAWRPGIPGIIPDPTTLCATVDSGLYGSGSVDATNAIQDAINHCRDGNGRPGYVWLPAGTYVFSRRLNLAMSGVVLRGDALNTVLAYQGPADTTAIYVGTAYFYADAYCDSGDGNGSQEYCSARKYAAITGGLDRGSTQITVEDASGIAVGDVLLIDQRNDPQLVDGMGSNGLCKTCGRAGGQRLVGQFVDVTAKADNTVTIDPPLHWTYTAALAPEASIIPAAHVTRQVGVEDLKLTQASPLARYLITMDGTVQSWVQNVEVEHPDSRCLLLLRGLRNVVRDSYFHDGINGFGNGHGYGIALDGYQTATLVENNALVTLSNFVMLAGGSGNVIAYNYFGNSRHDDCDQRTDGCWMSDGAVMNYAAHPHMNLWEGNSGSQLGAGFLNGSSSHNTVFRSRSTGWQPPRLETQQPWNYNAVSQAHKNAYTNFVGNVLGTLGRTNTYELAYPAPDDPSRITVWKFGYGAPDPAVAPFDEQGATSPRSTVLRHGNWDACAAAGTAVCANAPQGSVEGVVWDPTKSVRALPPSLYLTQKPFWFGDDVPWPPIGPDVKGLENKLPAQRRIEPAAQ
jgi:hypothetical protein